MSGLTTDATSKLTKALTQGGFTTNSSGAGSIQNVLNVLAYSQTLTGELNYLLSTLPVLNRAGNSISTNANIIVINNANAAAANFAPAGSTVTFSDGTSTTVTAPTIVISLTGSGIIKAADLNNLLLGLPHEAEHGANDFYDNNPYFNGDNPVSISPDGLNSEVLANAAEVAADNELQANIPSLQINSPIPASDQTALDSSYTETYPNSYQTPPIFTPIDTPAARAALRQVFSDNALVFQPSGRQPNGQPWINYQQFENQSGLGAVVAAIAKNVPGLSIVNAISTSAVSDASGTSQSWVLSDGSTLTISAKRGDILFGKQQYFYMLTRGIGPDTTIVAVGNGLVDATSATGFTVQPAPGGAVTVSADSSQTPSILVLSLDQIGATFGSTLGNILGVNTLQRLTLSVALGSVGESLGASVTADITQHGDQNLEAAIETGFQGLPSYIEANSASQVAAYLFGEMGAFKQKVEKSHRGGDTALLSKGFLPFSISQV